jgi:hypothetical protein
MAALVTELVTSWLHHKWQSWLSWQHTEQRNEAIRLGSDGSPGYRPGWKYRGNTEQRNEAIRLSSDGSPGFMAGYRPGN